MNRHGFGSVLATLTTCVIGIVVVLPLLAMGAGIVGPPDETCASSGHLSSSRPAPTILGTTRVDAADAIAWWRSSGRQQPPRLAAPIEQVISAYFTEAAVEGVRADLALAQAIHETGWFTNSDTARNNFAGIGHPDGRTSGHTFATPATGVRAHIQLLKRYAAGNNTPLAHAPVAPEAAGRATTWEDLAGTWAASLDYWTRIAAIYATMPALGSPGTVDTESCPPAAETSSSYEGTPGNVPLTTAEGITVHARIATQVAGLVQAAQADGHMLTGGGFRSPQRQIELRRQNCGPSNYAIYEMPSGQCSPPTARPGSSNHELGLAVDFSCNGALVRSRSSSCFAWMAANAPSFGLHNLPSEPWHWSVDGS